MIFARTVAQDASHLTRRRSVLGQVSATRARRAQQVASSTSVFTACDGPGAWLHQSAALQAKPRVGVAALRAGQAHRRC